MARAPRDAEPLLLPTGEVHGGLAQNVLHLVPEDRLSEALLHQGLQFALVLDAREFRGEGDVVENRLGEGIGLLEDHPDPLADLHGIDMRGIDVLPFEKDLPLQGRPADQVVHPVEESQQRRFPAPGRADQGRDPIPPEIHVDVGERPEGAVVKIDPRSR